jgi:hypothetical protein
MAKTCIICGNPAGSREHVFPASLGGRRTNKGIYCGEHNNGFSPLASIVSRQLKPINALLAVRPDHSARAEPLDYTSPEGEDLTIFDGVVKRAEPSEGSDEKWLRVQLNLGGLDGLRAVAYIALTFFAHHFQEYARGVELKGIKDFLSNAADNQFVWWENETTLSKIGSNPFLFGHTIVVALSASTRMATVFISLFQSLHFGVQLGQFETAADKSVLIFIDPHADSAPADLKETRYEVPIIDLTKPQPLQLHLEQMVRDGNAEKGLQRLLAEIERWKFDKDMLSVVKRLNAARLTLPHERTAAVEHIVQEQAGRVFRLMRHIVEGCIQSEDVKKIGRRLTSSKRQLEQMRPRRRA